MSTATKESDLVTAVLLYAMRCVAEGDQHALREMAFGPQEIEALRELNLSDLYRIGYLQAHCLAIALDREVFWPMLRHLRSTRESEEVQRDLVQADAPLEMMRALFGVSSREYTRMRRMLAVDPAVGRPPEPDEDTSHRLWHALRARLGDSQLEQLEPQDYLDIQQESGASLRAVWSGVQRWLAYGDVIACGASASAAKGPATARPCHSDTRPARADADASQTAVAARQRTTVIRRAAAG